MLLKVCFSDWNTKGLGEGLRLLNRCDPTLSKYQTLLRYQECLCAGGTRACLVPALSQVSVRARPCAGAEQGQWAAPRRGALLLDRGREQGVVQPAPRHLKVRGLDHIKYI